MKTGDAPAKSIEVVLEIFLGRRHVYAIEESAVHHSCEAFSADSRQHRVGEDVVDHPRAALQLLAPLDDEVRHGVVEGERDIAGK